MSSMMPLSGDRLSERTSFPFAHDAYANQSTTLCMAWSVTVPLPPAAMNRVFSCSMLTRVQNPGCESSEEALNKFEF